jgi:hypothetical protein
MQVRVVRDTVADGRVVTAGEVVDLPAQDAATLLRLGKAEALTDPPPVPKNPSDGPAPIPVMDAAVASVDGKPAQKRRR